MASINILVEPSPYNLWKVVIDPTELELAHINLGINARDAMPYGGRIRFGTELGLSTGRDLVVRSRQKHPRGRVNRPTNTRASGKIRRLSVGFYSLATQARGALRVMSEVGPRDNSRDVASPCARTDVLNRCDAALQTGLPPGGEESLSKKLGMRQPTTLANEITPQHLLGGPQPS
jgi:hypothetical protein